MCPPAGDAAAAGHSREVQRLAREVSPESMLTAEELRRVHVKKVEEDRASFPVGANERILEGEGVHSCRWWFFSVGANEPILEGE